MADDKSARALVALFTAGAAGVHAFAASAHDLSTLLGAGMAVTAAVQALGAGLLLWRGGRLILAAVTAVNAAAALTAALAHTTGLPLPGLRDPGAFDGQLVAVLCFEVAAVVSGAIAGGAAVAGGVRPLSGRLLIPVTALVVLAAAVPAATVRHDHADDPDHASNAHAGTGQNGAAGAHPPHAPPPDGSKQRYAAFTAGMSAQQVADALASHERWLTEYLLANSAGVTRPAAAEFSRRALRAVLESPEGNGGGHGHPGPAEWKPIGDEATRDKLAAELSSARTAALKLPTAAAAAKAGYVLVAPNLPGLGAHWLHPRYLLDGVLDPARPEVLLYAGNGPTAEVVGVSYLMVGVRATAPEGFAGPNDTWHFHEDLCMVARVAVPAVDRASCESVGGRMQGGFGGQALWMMHAWVVPGWESPWGLFSGENPELTLAVGRDA